MRNQAYFHLVSTHNPFSWNSRQDPGETNKWHLTPVGDANGKESFASLEDYFDGIAEVNETPRQVASKNFLHSEQASR